MSKPTEIRPIALFLIGWLAAFAVLFPQGVVVCVGELAHVELGILSSACCDEDSQQTAAQAGVSASLPHDTCSDGDHVLATSWHHRTRRDPGESSGWNVEIQSQPFGTPAAAFGDFEKDKGSVLLAVSCPTPSLPLEHLSTSILLC